MKYQLSFLLLFSLSSLTFKAISQDQKPVVPGDFADPSVIRQGNQYFAVGTSSEWGPHFPIFNSPDLKNWKQSGYVFSKLPEWASASFWAPEFYFHNNTYYLYYTARRKSDNISCIGVATSKYPDRDFKDHGIIIEYGKEAIDAFVFNDDGQLYITWKAYGLDGRPIEILGSKLANDGLTLTGKEFTMLKDEKKIGLEGQSILKKDDFYYLFYSVGACCGIQCDYNVRVARARKFEGPYEDYANNPVLTDNSAWKCPGHGTFVSTSAGKTYYLYHAYNKKSNVFTGRQGMLAELNWPGTNQWPSLTPDLATEISAKNIKDDFTTKLVTNNWQWDFRNSTPLAKQQKGNLHLSGSVKEGNNSGIALTVRPAAAAYEMTTTVVNHNKALKGLVIYGDANAAVGLGIAGDQIEYWAVKNNKKIVLGKEQITSKSLPVNLKLVAQADLTCKVYWSQGRGQWKELNGEGDYSIKFLPPWDRSPRPGINFSGAANEEAVFSSFALTYQ